jgi:hypothetical protein
VAKKSAALKQANVSNTKQKTHQKPTKDKKITEQTTVSAPAKVEAPVNTPVTASQHPRSCDSVLTRSTFYSQAMHCSMSFRAIVLLGSVALLTAFYQSMQPSAFTIPTGLTQRQLVRPGTGFLWIRYRAGRHFRAFPSSQPHLLWRVAVFGLDLPNANLLANRTKTVTGWTNALDEPRRFDVDAPNEDQCGLSHVGAPAYDQRGPFDAPNDNQCTPSESVVASPEVFERSP